MTDVAHRITTTYVVNTDAAVRETQKLATAQDKHAKQAARAMELFERDATAALRKVEKEVNAQEKAWERTLKKMAEGEGVFGKIEKGIKGFNSTIGTLAMGLGAIPRALEVVAIGAENLGKAWNFVAGAFDKPQLKMMWDKGASDSWIARAKEMAAASDLLVDNMITLALGADVDGDKSTARRLASRAEVLRLRKQASDNADYLSQRQVAGQGAAADRQRAESAARAARNRIERPYELRANELDGSQWTANYASMANDEMERIVDDGSAMALRFGAEGTEMGRRGGGPAARTGRALAEANGPKAPTLLERMFGTPEDIGIYRGLMDGLMGAVSSGYEALVTGSESFGKAAKRVIGQSIMAEGSHMMVLAVKEAAWGIGALARGNLPEAAGHALAAAKFGAGAALAGVVAQGLGANEAGGWGGRPAGASASGVGLGGGGQGQGDNTTIILGDGWEDETPRARANRLARGMRRASVYAPAPLGIRYS